MTQPFLLPWVRVLLLIRSITSTTWGHEAWPEVKPILRRAELRTAGAHRSPPRSARFARQERLDWNRSA
jgi:hypothetical protein